MSIVALVWAKKQKTESPSRKAVLMVLADYADEHGRAWPSQVTIARETELSERTVRTCLSELEAAGFLRRQARWNPNGGSRGTDILHLDLDGSNRKDLPVGGKPEKFSGKTKPANGADHTGNSRQTIPATVAGELPVRTTTRTTLPDGSGDGKAAAPELSLKDRLWLDGVAALVSLGISERLAKQMVGRWLRDSENDAGRVLWAIEEAVNAGSGDPIPYVTRLLSDRSPTHGERSGTHPARLGGGTKYDNVASGVALGTAIFRQRSGGRAGHYGGGADHEAHPDDPREAASDASPAVAYLAAYR